jgi:hypothetical protein
MTKKSLLPNARIDIERSLVLTLLMVVVAASGCPVRLIGDYDDTIDNGVTAFHHSAEAYLTKLQSNPSTPFDQSVYDDLDARLAVLRARATSLPKYGIIATQLANVKMQVDDLQKVDKSSPRPLAGSIAAASESAISVSVESILKLELALKRGDDPADQSK